MLCALSQGERKLPSQCDYAQEKASMIRMPLQLGGDYARVRSWGLTRKYPSVYGHAIVQDVVGRDG